MTPFGCGVVSWCREAGKNEETTRGTSWTRESKQRPKVYLFASLALYAFPKSANTYMKL